jgi:hypothetical protein
VKVGKMEVSYKETTEFSAHPTYGDIDIDIFDLETKDEYTLYYCNHFTKINRVPPISGLFANKKDHENLECALIFVSACSFFFDHPELMYPGYATPSGGEILDGSPLVSFYLTFPQKFGIPSIDHDALLFVAITEQELDFLNENGPEELDNYFISNNIDIFNINRQR